MLDIEKSRIEVVFILSARRSGSTWLNLVLGSHSWARNLGEYYRPFDIPGHVACRLCEAEGLPECTVLHGLEKVARADAFHFAAERTGRRVLIDASKSLGWTQEFLGRGDIDIRLVHLVRHPCGFVASQRRRQPDLPVAHFLASWESENREIADFIAGSGVPAHLVCYDDLANAPDETFPALCDVIGHPFEPDALRYWETPHHGLGGNGAASLYLRDRKKLNYLTGDDAFYDTLTARPVAADDRWTDELEPATRADIVASAPARQWAARLGKSGWKATQ